MCSLKVYVGDIKRSEVWSWHRPRPAVWPGAVGQASAASSQGGVPCGRQPLQPSRSLLSQETAFRADTASVGGSSAISPDL